MIEPRFVKLNDYLNESFERRELTWATDDLTGLRLAEEKGNFNSKVEHFIIMQNVTRRHLSDWQKFKNILAFENGGKLPKHGGDRKSKKKDQGANSAPCSEIAKTLNVSPRKVKQMIAIEKNVPEEIKGKLNNDEMSINKAAEETKKVTKEKSKKVGQINTQQAEFLLLYEIWQTLIEIRDK
jgi:hypothetical protein